MSRIIVALDGMSWFTAEEVIWRIKDYIWGVKFNDLLVNYGTSIVRHFSTFTNVMADPKLYDIPNTICNGVTTLVDAGASIVTIHATAEYNTDEDKKEYRKHIAGITILTSMSKDWQERIYNTKYGDDLVPKLAKTIVDRGWGYTVCSAEDLLRLRIHDWFLPHIKTICPSIALSTQKIKKDDQRKRFTPAEAVKNGADFIVVGRAITQSDNALEVVKQINKEVEEVEINEGLIEY